MVCRLHVYLLSGVICSCVALDYGWLPHKEYVFTVQGLSLVGLPQLKQQFAGFQYNGQIRVQSHSPRVLLAKLSNMSYTKIHEELRDGWWAGLQAQKNKTLVLPTPTSTIVVKLNKLYSPELIIKSGLDDWQVNFIKGIISKIVAFMGDNTESPPNSNQRTYSQQKDVFTIVEESVSGRCEVLYEVSELPPALSPVDTDTSRSLCHSRRHWEITKTVNHSNCEVVSEDHSHLVPGNCPPGGDHCASIWTRASLTQLIGCGEKSNFVLLSSISSSMMVSQLHLQNNSQANINCNLNITLKSVHELSEKFNTPSNKQTVKSLLYSYSASIKESGSVSEEETIETRQKGPGSHSYSQTNPASNKKGMDPLSKQHSKHRYERSTRRKQGTDDHFSGQSNVHSFYEGKIPNDFQNNNENGFGRGNWNPSQESSESLEDQPSEEMQLEDQFEITGKEARVSPPHQPFSMFSLAHRTSYSLSCLNPKLRQLVGDIASDLEEVNILPEKNTMDKLNIAIDICRLLPLDMLTEVSEEVFQVYSHDANPIKVNERKVFRDVMTMCGTHPALQLIRGWIERKQVEGEEAAEMIAAMPSNIVSPTKYMVQDFFEMTKQIDENNDQQLSSTAALALSNLVRYTCVNSGARKRYFSSIVKPVCDKNLANEVIEWIARRVDSQPSLRTVHITALGNIGSPDIVFKLKDIALNAKYSTYHRTSAVYAMRYLALKRNNEVSSMLLSLYSSYKVPVSTRLAAVSLLVYSSPGHAVWQRLAISTWYEPSPAAQQFVSSTIRTMATSRDSFYSHVTKSAKLVLPLAKPVRLNSHQPYNLLNSWLSNDLENIILQQISWMQFSDYTNFYYRHTSRISGFSRTNVEASFQTTNPDDLWSALKDLMLLSKNERHYNDLNPVIDYNMAKIRKGLGIQTLKIPELQADMHFKINNIMERMLPLDANTLKYLQKGGSKFVTDIQGGGKAISYQKAYVNTFYISTTTDMGFPIEFSLRTPSIIKARLELHGSNNLTGGMSLMYSSQLVSSVSVMSPWDHTAHTAGAYATNFIQLPFFRIAAKFNNKQDESESLEVKTDFVDQHRLLYVSMQPFTSQRKLKIHHPALLSPDTRKIKLKDTVQMPIPWMSRYLNSVYTSEKTSDFNPMKFVSEARGVLGFPLLLSSMEARSFETVMNPLHPVTMTFSMSMSSKSSNLLEVYSPKNTILGKIYNSWFYAGEKNDVTNDREPTDSKPVNNHQFSNSTVHSTQHPNGNNNGTEQKDMKKIHPDDMMLLSSESHTSAIKLYNKTFESAVGDFNASTVDPFKNQLNGSNHYYLMDTILGKINSGDAVVVSLDLTSTNQDQSLQVSAYGAYAASSSNTVARYGIFLKKDETEVKLTAVHEDPEHVVTDLKRKLQEDLQYKLVTDFVYNHHGQSANVFFQAKYGAAKTNVAQLLSSPHLETCSKQVTASVVDQICQQLHSQAREIASWNGLVYYNDEAKYLENLARMYMITARMMLPDTVARPGEVKGNTMYFTVEMRRQAEAIDMFVAIPGRSLEMHNLLLPLPLPALMEWATQDSVPTEYCGVSPVKVRTFDGAEFNNTFKSHVHLITQDCSGKYGFSVMAKPSRNNSLSLIVNIDDHFVITVEEGPKVSVNRHEQPLDSASSLLQLLDYSGHVVAHASLAQDNSLVLNLPDHALHIVYSDHSLIIRAQSKLQGRLCGLCGSYSRTGQEQFLTPQGRPATSVDQFISSYQTNDDQL